MIDGFQDKLANLNDVSDEDGLLIIFFLFTEKQESNEDHISFESLSDVVRSLMKHEKGFCSTAENMIFCDFQTARSAFKHFNFK